jgi:hypothetical protein
MSPLKFFVSGLWIPIDFNPDPQPLFVYRENRNVDEIIVILIGQSISACHLSAL